MAYYRDGLKYATHIWEAAAMHHLVRVECKAGRCVNTATFDPHCLWGLFYRRRWDDRFTDAQRRFWCKVCTEMTGFRVKSARIISMGTSIGDVTHRLPYPDEREWKNFLSRHRG